MAKVRLQIAPEMEFKMEVDLEGVDTENRDWNIQQHKSMVYAEFEQRLRKVFPEGFRIHSFEFGPDHGWHEKLSDED